MKKILFLILICFALNLQAASVISVQVNRIYNADGTFNKWNVLAYTDANDGKPFSKDLTTQAQINALSDLLDITTFQLSKLPDRTWVFYNVDGTINRIDHQLTSNFRSKVTQGADVPSQLVTGIQNLKIAIENLINN